MQIGRKLGKGIGLIFGQGGIGSGIWIGFLWNSAVETEKVHAASLFRRDQISGLTDRISRREHEFLNLWKVGGEKWATNPEKKLFLLGHLSYNQGGIQSKKQLSKRKVLVNSGGRGGGQ